ncbi:MAG: DNA-3-methyladenine glycosylase I [Propionibacteriaceae bacterium]|uniref:DNA-3-methyladenine glycosylase I n=1 Tax=Propionibacterium ruminifibrarum TaxID=1962131 RepID=A0A375I3Q7_9ACTN|nr:DNA-3-methyladenine glycosylase I [Propionibacterium ruminifibrarum]MBE6476657.1 DNA-3-methyladenine glycosylase I [Propionibacteriaceae bacterium]SPF69547.1 DNA-3-methyladenine glycosylase I [Propionibacterium ruminifibrarum]
MSAELIVGEDGRVRPVWAAHDPLLRDYYDHEWGAPVTDERGLYERLCLEAFQSGLSWATILRKRPAFRRAFAGFDVDRVARFGPADVERLLTDASIVRNRRKIEAAVTNARATRALRDRGGLPRLVWSFLPPAGPRPASMAEIPTRSPQSEALARALRAEGFVFVGPTTMYAMMQAIGMVDDRLEGADGLIEAPGEPGDAAFC